MKCYIACSILDLRQWHVSSETLLQRVRKVEEVTVKRSSISIVLVLALAVCEILITSPQLADAQQVSAAITGTVLDPTGAAINGATVNATDVNRGTVWKTETNSTGTYNLPRLPVGTYQIQADAKGFQTEKYGTAITLELNQTATVDLKMKVGNQSEVV